MADVSPVELLRSLLRFDTRNPPGNEAECIGFVEGLLREAGLETRTLEKEPGRPNLIARLPGRGAAPPLLLQGHVDVVPTDGQDWSRDPFAAELEGGFVWGRGTLDMKAGVTMMLHSVLRARAEGLEPAGDVILCVLADEEAGSDLGAAFLVEEHPELFDGVRHAIGEFGGFTFHVGGKRFYPVQVAEKRTCWMRGVVRGPGGHGSLPMRGGTMARTAAVLQRLDRGRLPVHVTDVVRMTVDAMAPELGFPQGAALRSLMRPALTNRVLDALGQRGELFDPLLHNTVNATIVSGGSKINVIPSEVGLELDGRMLPGFSTDEMLAEVRALAGDELEDLEVARSDGAAPPEPDMGMWDTLAGILSDADPGGTPVPQLLAAVTDGRFFAELGIQTYGFTPMRLPEGFEFTKLIHAADERIPADAVDFGADAVYRVLERYGA